MINKDIQKLSLKLLFGLFLLITAYILLDKIKYKPSYHYCEDTFYMDLLMIPIGIILLCCRIRSKYIPRGKIVSVLSFFLTLTFFASIIYNGIDVIQFKGIGLYVPILILLVFTFILGLSWIVDYEHIVFAVAGALIGYQLSVCWSSDWIVLNKLITTITITIVYYAIIILLKKKLKVDQSH